MSEARVGLRLKSVVVCPAEKSDGTPRPFVGLEDIAANRGTLKVEPVRMMAAAESVLYRAGDVLFGKLRPYLAKSFLAKEPGSATGELLVLRPQGEIDNRFLLYMTLSKPWLTWAEATSYGAKMPRTSWQGMSEYLFDLPALDEQRRIVDYLDVEVKKFEQLMLWREAQVARLTEALHSEASRCTQPLANELGKARTEWQHTTLRRVASRIQTGVTPADALMPLDRTGPNLVPWYTPLALGDTLELSSAEQAVYVEDAAQLPQFHAYSILIVGIGESLGKVADLDHVATGNQQLTAIAPSDSVDRRFLAWQLLAARAKLRSWAQYSRVRILNNDNLKAFPVWLPSAPHQLTIREELDRRLLDLTDFRSTATKFARLASERRQALITAAVTQQIDVSTARGVTA